MRSYSTEELQHMVNNIHTSAGYLNERYLWALVSGVGIFFVGCGVSTWHGVCVLARLRIVF